MLPDKSPERKLKVTIPLTRRSVGSLETTPLDSPVKSEATTSSESTFKGNDRNEETGPDAIVMHDAERSRTGGNMKKSDREERDITASLAHIGLSHIDNVDPESLTRLGLLYIDTDGTEMDRETTKIRHWNCHECCKINEIEAENPRSWEDVGSEYCTNLECKHNRCCDCYFLDCEWEPLQYCDGRPVDPEIYQEWYNNFERV